MGRHNVELRRSRILDDLTVPTESGDQEVLDRVNRVVADAERDFTAAGIEGDQISE